MMVSNAAGFQIAERSTSAQISRPLKIQSELSTFSVL
jgi:hypothetical protein